MSRNFSSTTVILLQSSVCLESGDQAAVSSKNPEGPSTQIVGF